jgi:hypothetical protein
MFFSSCTKKGTDDTSTAIKNTYAGSGAYGDLVTFDINQTYKSYTTHNETTNQLSSGNYTILDGQLQGIYKVTAASNTFFAVELNNKFLAANFPTGNTKNNLSMGISSKIDNTNNMTNIAGDYAYIEIDANGYFGDGNYKEWGVVTVATNGVFKGRAFATGGTYGLAKTISPEQWTGFPITGTIADQDFSGTFTIDAAHKERLTVAVNNAPGADYHGFVYATSTEGVLILDEGVGKGFIFAIKVNNSSTLANIVGSYKYISVLKQNSLNVPVGGNATILSNGSGTYTQMFPNGTIENGTLQGLTQCPNIKNMYYGNMSSTQPDGKFYVCIVGNIYFNFAFKTDGKFAFYGAGGKL